MRASQPEGSDRRVMMASALKRFRKRLRRKLDALHGDLAEAQRAGEHRRAAETLLASLKDVPKRAARVSLPEPHDPGRRIEIALDPALSPQANAARYFKRAAKAERAQIEVPPRIESVAVELTAIESLLDRTARAVAADRAAARLPSAAEGTNAAAEADPTLDADLEAWLRTLPAALQSAVVPEPVAKGLAKERVKVARASGKPVVPARLQPRRLKSREGWDVWIGRSNEGNDYLTHRLARGEDYWFHVHGAAGSHVVLRRGKGKNEPSKQTLAEVASWAAYYSQARTAGKVPVIYTRKKYVRKPRKAPPGTALAEREKTVMVRPEEPPRSATVKEEA